MIQEDYTFINCEDRINKGKLKLNEYISDYDLELVETFIVEQIKVVGNRKVFVIVDRILKQGVIEFSLLKELCDLYKWRRKFIDEKLPVLKGAWFTNSFCRDVITFQITRNFDQILKIAASSKLTKKSDFPTEIFLSSDGEKSRAARYRIDNLEILYHLHEKTLWKYYFLTEKFLPGSHLLYSDIVSVIMEHHSVAPKSLLQLAMTCVKKNGVSWEMSMDNIMKTDLVGYNRPLDEIDTNNLNDDGKELLSILQKVHELLKVQEGFCTE